MSFLNDSLNKKNIQLTDFPFLFLQDHVNGSEIRKQAKDRTISKNPSKVTSENNLLSNVFFSKENIELINKKIVLEVFKITKIKIPLQNVETLFNVMVDVYHNYARNLPFKIKSQIKDLDAKVVNNVVPDILTSLDQKINYLNTITSDLNPIALPENVNLKKTNKGSSDIFH